MHIENQCNVAQKTRQCSWGRKENVASRTSGCLASIICLRNALFTVWELTNPRCASPLALATLPSNLILSCSLTFSCLCSSVHSMSAQSELGRGCSASSAASCVALAASSCPNDDIIPSCAPPPARPALARSLSSLSSISCSVACVEQLSHFTPPTLSDWTYSLKHSSNVQPICRCGMHSERLLNHWCRTGDLYRHDWQRKRLAHRPRKGFRGCMSSATWDSAIGTVKGWPSSSSSSVSSSSPWLAISCSDRESSSVILSASEVNPESSRAGSFGTPAASLSTTSSSTLNNSCASWDKAKTSSSLSQRPVWNQTPSQAEVSHLLLLISEHGLVVGQQPVEV